MWRIPSTDLASIPVGYGLRFVATPAVGFQFAEWTVTLNGTAVAWEDEAFQGIVTFTKTESAAILRVSSLEALIQAAQGESEGSGEDAAPVLQVQAAFTSQNRTVTFSADESTPNGTVTAQQNGQSLNSGVSVAHGSSVTYCRARPGLCGGELGCQRPGGTEPRRHK